ncbi:MAG: TetR/AcrR family transcriptional regulator [Bacteroidales bacterium]|nr:TetR/AcrR family transcriptional regulator [Bacteroidales bacterium]HPD96513.1 TetR/AcrR family transcriptional regulator [Tenuifilaceae bacterium]
MGHVERRKKEKENIRKGILDAALKIAMSDGWGAVTIRKIADVIEYTPPIVYEYFKNKDDLLDELALMGHRMLYQEYENVKQKETDAKKILMQLSINHWDFAFEHKELYQLMFSFNRVLPSEEAHAEILQIKNLFLELTNDKALAGEVMFSWMCLQQGFIYNMKQKGLPPELSSISPKDLYTRIMRRFILSI